ncbi:MAG: carboxypeptidase-like regulatory domain-containing protein [Flavobacteriaceae bacterium]|nr:carboxypeptidase-like regulatory domain-containing protein [Bacteroidia bacterium]NNK88536.1 carboxypeptidase-like regulatory domain-containing protein [Flavobacteriaceae bacterium]
MNYSLKLIAVLVLMLSSSIAFSQDGSISGTVIDAEFSEPLAFTNVKVKGTGITTTSDFEGHYMIDLEPGRYTLVFSFAGYGNVEYNEVLVKAYNNTAVDVTLTPRSINTEAITSSADKNNE